MKYDPAAGFLQIRGSLHTFAHGHNLGTFTAAEARAACAELAGVLDVPPERPTVHRLEVGLNMPVAFSPRQFIESLASHKNRPFVALTPPPKASRPLLYGAHHSDYRVKFYDKGAYSRLQGRHLPDTAAPHLLRYEVVFERQRPMLTVTGLSTLTLADLPRPPVIAAFANHLRTHWNLTQRRQHMNYADLSLSDAALLHAATDVAFWEIMRATQPRSTYARNKARATALLRERTEPHPYDAVFARELASITQLAAAA
ncbi:hypothetical protein AUC43_03045 [Hymenobacter sedentarius]|uniref:Uncharacterized protein n=1 Tax=Hymenobacter sedentarius TaxID=1411621 RepID=A0A0U3SUF0_9BACT|nr:hypothetical protein [Hymenobacter sedentarius]ALW84163.1 hypothetical protein AUC43_03045 [Hymenobacter sedentarius]